MGIKRFGNKLIGGIKRFGHKHKGKVAVVGAIAAGAGAAYASGEEDRIKNNAARRAEEIMNTLDKERESEAQAAHDRLMKDAQPQPQRGFAPKPAKSPGLIQTAINIPGTLKQAEKSAQQIESSSVLQKGKAIQKGAVDTLGAVTAPSKKEQKRVSQEQRFLEGKMSDAEAQEFIKKQGGRKVAKKSKKAEKGAKKRKKKSEKKREKEFNKDPKYKKGLYDF